MAAENFPFFAHLINQFAPEHNNLNIIREKLRNLGLFLVFCGASIVLGAIPERSANIENISIAFAIFAVGIMMVWLSLVVNLFPRTAASVNAVLEPAIFIVAMWLIYV